MLPTLNLTTTEQRLLTNSVSKSRKIKSLLIAVRRPNCYVIRQATFAFVTYSQQDRERVENENQNEYEKFLACIKTVIRMPHFNPICGNNIKDERNGIISERQRRNEKYFCPGI